MTPYQLFLLGILIAWPFAAMGLLFLMNRFEHYLERSAAGSPQEAGLEPVEGIPTEREVKVVFGDEVVGGS